MSNTNTSRERERERATTFSPTHFLNPSPSRFLFHLHPFFFISPNTPHLLPEFSLSLSCSFSAHDICFLHLSGFSMALKPVVTPSCAVSYGGKDHLGLKFGLRRTWSVDSNKTQKWNLLIRCLEDDKQSKTGHELRQLVDHSGTNLTSLPKPLSVTESAASTNNGAKVRIAFKGLPGAYSEDAALKAYPQCKTVPCEEFEDVLKAVEQWVADKAVLPIESSLGGSIHRNYDLLLRHRLHIVGEVQLLAHFCLLALPGVRQEQLERVLSHPQALAQSDRFLNKLGIIRENVDDTAAAAQFIASNNLRDAAAVASARAAEIYGLNVLAHGIQDDPHSITRFLVLARDPIIPKADKPFKTSIVFTLEEGPGVLFKALAVFSLRDINLTKMESRPQRKRPLRVVDDSDVGTAKYFDYLFYIDFEASMAEPRAQNALVHLQEFATFLRVLGCYPIDAL